MIFILGALGFLGFEVGRLYHKIRQGEKILTIYGLPEILVVIFMANFSGVMAIAISDGMKSALFVGLTTPALIQSIEKARYSGNLLDHSNDSTKLDDVELMGKPTFIKGIIGAFKRYFH